MLATCKSLMSGDDAQSGKRGNNLAVFAVRGNPGLADRAARLVGYMKSAQPIDPRRPVLVPGELERLHAEGSSALLETQLSRRTVS